MLDIILAIALANHYGRRADYVGRPRAGVFRAVLGICLGAEATGLVLAGVQSGWSFGYVAVGGLAGLASGVVLGSLVGSNLTLTRMSRDGEPPVVLGASLGPQVIGASCPVCARPIAMLFDARRCKRCKQPVHKKCLSDHRAAHRFAGRGYRDAPRR